MVSRSKQLGADEIEHVLRGRASPIGGPQDLADILGLSRSTVYEWIAKDRLKGAMRKRGKHVLIRLIPAIDIIFNGPEWSENNDN